MKDIYILLTKSDTLFSKAIYRITRAEYTHASISLDRELTMLYSFGRKYKYTMLPAGFVHEDINHGIMGASDTMKCALYCIRISDRSYQRLANRIRHMEANRESYRYNIMGIPLCMFGIANERKTHFFCSQFVSGMLIKSGAIDRGALRAPSLTHPSDLQKLPRASRVFEGTMAELRLGA